MALRDSLPKKKPAADPDPTIRYACGHALGRKHFTDRKCPHCVTADRQARKARQRAQRAEQPSAADFTAWQRDLHQRLPAGARFDVRYDAAALRWSGELSVPAASLPEGVRGLVGGDTLIFREDSGGVFKLLAKLDALYRAWLLGAGPPGETP